MTARPAAGRIGAAARTLGALAALALAPGPAPAQGPAAPDSSLHGFLEALADSTDRYFGPAAAPLDTAGLDSALAAGLARPWTGPPSRMRVSLRPAYTFSRVDGSRWGGSLEWSGPRAPVRVRADAGYAAGSDTWLGGGEAVIALGAPASPWRVRLAGGRRTEGMNRDLPGGGFATVRALVFGNDRFHYLRRDGYAIGVARAGPGWRTGLEFRDRLESPLAVTTRWNLARRDLTTPGNIAAWSGRARELALAAETRLPGPRARLRLTVETADGAFGSDFDYRRTHLSLGGEIAVARRVSLVPQAAYGRLGGDPVPQASFYLGGPRTLRSLPREALGGTGLALARLDAIGADDLLALVRIPHPAVLPLQGGAFVAAGAVWGADPFGGPGGAAGAWPARRAWLAEAGLSLLWRPGVPAADDLLRVHVAWPLGSRAAAPRFSVSFSRALDVPAGVDAPE